MVLVPDGVVVVRIGSLALTAAAACCLGCSGADVSETSRLPATEEREAVCHTGETGGTQPNSGAIAWLQNYGVSEISSVASNGDGGWLVAQSGKQTLKVDRDGKQLWAVPFGWLVAADGSDQAYVASGRELVKLDAQGNALYAVSLQAGAEAEAASLAVDRFSHVVVSGPGIGTVKLDSAGQIAWTKEYFGQVALDRDGNVLLAGALEGSRDFGAGTLVSRGGEDVFVLKLTPDGDLLFARSFGDEGAQQRGESVSVDRDGNALVAGVFDGRLDFGDGAPLEPSRCASDAWCETSGFAVKLDALGNTSWSRELGALRSVASTASDAAAGFVLSGALPGGVSPFRSSWLVALASDGRQLWRRAEWPETGIGAGGAVAVDACSNVLWSVTARPDLQTSELSYLAKLMP